MKKMIVVIACATFLGACSSTGKTTSRIDADDTIGGIDVVKVASVEKEMVPVWYLDPGADTDDVMYAVSTAMSNDMEYAVTRATHQAQSMLANKIAARSSGKFKQYVSESQTQSSFATVTQFKNVPVTNYRVVNKAVFKEGGAYRAYVNLAYATSTRGYSTMSSANNIDQELRDLER